MTESKSKQKKEFKIRGMSCSSCALKIEKNLQKREGVIAASVSPVTEKAFVDFDAAQVTDRDIKEIITETGFEVVEEKADASLEEEENEEQRELAQMKRKLLISALLAGTIMVLMVIHMLIIPVPGYLAITVLLGFPVIFGTGLHVHKASFKALRNKSPNMDVLVSLGSLPPYLVGLAGFFFPIQTFIEMAVSIMTLHLVGKYLEVKAKGRASQAIKKLLQMGAKTARIIMGEEEIEVPVKELQKGDVMVIRPGEKIPTDGVVIEGKSLVDESMATGESMPVNKATGDELIGATINKNGLLKVEVTKVGKETFLAQVIKMVEECQGSKVPIQEFADRITSYFVPAIMVLTLLVFISFNLFSSFHLSILEWGAGFLPWVNPNFTPLTLAFIASTAVLVIACPCALGLGTPTALMVGSGIGAEKGILIRNGETIQTIKEVKCIAFDKTGTITVGKPVVTDLIAREGVQKTEMLSYAASLEKASEHPLAHAILEEASKRKLSLDEVKEFYAITGRGAKGVIKEKIILVGNRELLVENQIIYEDMEEQLISLEEEGKTVILVAVENKLLGLIAVTDPLKPEAIEAIKELESMQIKTVMITGDNRRTAAVIGKKVGMSHVVSEVLPAGKVEEIRRLQEEYGLVAMVGDGINDAPALKQANVGIAIGTGTDIAIEAADLTLVSGELSALISAIKLSKATFRKIKENYFWAWFYNAIAIPIAMLGLLHPMIGAAAMSLSSLNVVYNSLRLKKVDIEPRFLRVNK